MQTSTAVQNNKQYIFYNGSTKIACDITFWDLIMLLLCFKITREEKAWLILSASHSVLYIFLFSILVFCSLASAPSMSTAHSGFPGYFTYFNCSTVYLHREYKEKSLIPSGRCNVSAWHFSSTLLFKQLEITETMHGIIGILHGEFYYYVVHNENDLKDPKAS